MPTPKADPEKVLSHLLKPCIQIRDRNAAVPLSEYLNREYIVIDTINEENTAPDKENMDHNKELYNDPEIDKKILKLMELLNDWETKKKKLPDGLPLLAQAIGDTLMPIIKEREAPPSKNCDPDQFQERQDAAEEARGIRNAVGIAFNLCDAFRVPVASQVREFFSPLKGYYRGLSA